MATFTTKQLGIGALSTTLTTTLYTTPGATRAVVTGILLCNTATTTSRNVTIKAGPATKRTILPARAIQAGETLNIGLNVVLEAADVIQGGQDSGVDVDYIISGVEIT